MAELDKNKAGLQKQVSSVFKGVPLPQNNKAPQPSDTPTPDHKPGVSSKPAPANSHISKSSLISKLSQSEDSSDEVQKNQTANVFPKPTIANQKPQSPMINKRPQPKESLEQPVPAVQSEEGPFIGATGVGLWQQIKDKLFTPKPGVNPTKQKALVIMVPILAIIMIFVLRQVLSKSPHKTQGAGTDDAPVVVANADTGNEIDWKIPEPITIITRDPIQLPGESNMQNPEQGEPNKTSGNIMTGMIIVKDIVFSKDKPSAVIGSKIVYVGDVINDITIIKIDRDSVEFEKNGDRWEQKVREGTKIPILEVTGQSEGQSETVQ
jgi:hypothetical protein